MIKMTCNNNRSLALRLMIERRKLFQSYMIKMTCNNKPSCSYAFTFLISDEKSDYTNIYAPGSKI
jgi:hypothetical protein